jgi:hypothetical protein
MEFPFCGVASEAEGLLPANGVTANKTSREALRALLRSDAMGMETSSAKYTYVRSHYIYHINGVLHQLRLSTHRD